MALTWRSDVRTLKGTMFERAPRAEIDFADYCAAVRAWLASAPEPDAALVAVADLLDAHVGLSETEVTRFLRDADDVHTMVGAGVLLDLREVCHE
jgi:hypothetical protein